LAQCHLKDIAHRDLKLENLLLDDQYGLLIADFGLAGQMKGENGSKWLDKDCGTEGYKAPEIHSGLEY